MTSSVHWGRRALLIGAALTIAAYACSRTPALDPATHVRYLAAVAVATLALAELTVGYADMLRWLQSDPLIADDPDLTTGDREQHRVGSSVMVHTRRMRHSPR